MKFPTSYSSSTSMAGVLPLSNYFDKQNIGKDFVSFLGERPPQSYQYDEIAKGWFITSIAKGGSLRHAEKIRHELRIVRNFKHPSHDTYGRAFKLLATKNDIEHYENKTNKRDGPTTYVSNKNERLVDLNIEMCKRLGLVEGELFNVLDIDTTYLKSKCKEATYSYKGMGFFPALAFIGRHPLASEMRSGNFSPQYKVADYLQDVLVLLQKHNVNVWLVRMDSAGYKADLPLVCSVFGISFIVGMRGSDVRWNDIEASKPWSSAKLKRKGKLPLDVEYMIRPHEFEKPLTYQSVVVIRTKAKFKMKEWIERNGYYYKAVLTNIHDKHPIEIIDLYNKRGDSENVIKRLKSSGVHKVPFSKLNENHVYMLMQIINHNLYQAYIRIATAAKIGITANIELLNYRESFISGVAKWIGGKYSFSRNNEVKLKKIM